MKNLNMRSLARWACFLAALIWGSSFIIVKSTIDIVPTHYLLFFRFTIGAAALSLISAKRFKHLDPGIIKRGAIAGVILFACYSTQTLGVSLPVLGPQATTAGKSAFLTGLYCVITPFIIWFIHKKRPDRFNLSAAFLCIIGIGFVVLSGDISGVLLGDMLTLITALLTALYIVLAAHFSQERDVMLLTIVQFITVAILSIAAALIFETFPANVPAQAYLSIVYLAIFCTAIGLGLQNFGQKYSPPSAASILLSLEAPFGALFAIFVGGGEERLTPFLAFGFVLIFASIIISETRLSFIPAFRGKE